MEHKGYKIESIKNDGHLQRVAFGIYKNGKLISTAETSREAQHEIDDMINRPITVEYLLVNKKNDSKSRETIKTTESEADRKIKELERKYWNNKNYEIRDIRKVRDMKAIDKLDKAIKSLDSWTSAYKQFEDIIDKYFNQPSKINSEVKKLYEKHKGEKDFEEAYKRWNHQ
nr:MAG TPA: hypothetical protein [Caudoviricetes sp.]